MATLAVALPVLAMSARPSDAVICGRWEAQPARASATSRISASFKLAVYRQGSIDKHKLPISWEIGRLVLVPWR